MTHLPTRRDRARHGYGLLVAAACLLAAFAQPVTGTQESPDASPIPDACGVEPRSVDEMFALAASLPEPVNGFGAPFPPGPPPDAATTAAITATVRQLEACINTGDFLRVLALFSDDGAMVRDWPLTDEFTAEFRAMEEATPSPVPEGSRQMLIGLWAARMLHDGRVAAAVLFTYENETPFAEATKALFFVEKDGRWQIDEWTESVMVPGRELSVQVEHAVDPPPGVTMEWWPPYRDDEDRPARRKKRRDAPAEETSEAG